MNLDLSHALDEIAEDAGRQADLGPADRLVRRRRRRRVARRTVAGAGTLAVAGGLTLAATSLADGPVPAALPGTTAPTPGPALTTPPAPTSSPTSYPGPAPTAGLPLKDPFVPRWDGTTDVVSPSPSGVDPTVPDDGDYLAVVVSVDPGARVLDVSLRLFHGGADGTWVQPDVQYRHTLPVAPDAVVTGYCQDEDGGLTQRAQTLETLLEAPGPDCSGPSPDRSRTYVWVDVRGGVVQQVVGQGWPSTS